MPKKLHTPMDGETPLFITDSTGGGPLLHTWQQLERFPGLTEAPLTDVEAPSNDLFNRYFHLGNALLALGKSSQRRGFGHAVKIEPHATQIWGEYKGVTPVVVEGAARNVDKFELEAKKEFWKATGFISLITAETVTKEEAQERARVMWDGFYFRFAGSANADHREEFKKKIRTYHKNYKKKAAQNSIILIMTANIESGPGQSDAELGPEPQQPAPPRHGESDEQIRQRHREALRNRDDSPPPGFDPELSRQMLHRLKSGDFTAPEQDQS